MPQRRSTRWLGQHFLKSPKLAHSLVERTNVSSSELVIEIGAGDGILTKELARRAAQVVAVEIDPLLVLSLVQRFSKDEKVLLVFGDFFEFPLPGRAFRVFGNVPFDKTTRVLRYLLGAADVPISRADLIVQVGAAIKRTQRWNLLNLCWAPWWDFATTARIPSRAFRPAPSVDAALLTISKKASPLLPEEDTREFARFARVVWPAANVRTGMKSLLPARGLHNLSRQLGFSLSASPSELDLDQWVTLYLGHVKAR
ncbi:MAG: rRNA adenine N(6)-methyltransferase family protein [Actinomycetota bacterium]|nr:rRNA adenine N(6)-methyltransferase family protein [Actinomycetota bacterium]